MGKDYIRYFLANFFAASSGRSDEQAIKGFLQALTASGRKEELHCDLIDAFEDERLCWRTLLWNDAYQVRRFANETEAKAYVRKMMWEPLYWPEP